MFEFISRLRFIRFHSVDEIIIYEPESSPFMFKILREWNTLSSKDSSRLLAYNDQRYTHASSTTYDNLQQQKITAQRLYVIAVNCCRRCVRAMSNNIKMLHSI